MALAGCPEGRAGLCLVLYLLLRRAKGSESSWLLGTTYSVSFRGSEELSGCRRA